MHVTGDISVWPNAARICIPGSRDGTEFVGSQQRFDELGAVEHQDEHAVADPYPAPGQRAGQPGDPIVEFGPGGGVSQEPQRGFARLHQRMPCELDGPVLAAGKVRLIFAVDICC